MKNTDRNTYNKDQHRVL